MNLASKIQSLDTKTLLALYNSLAGRSASKFASRVKGEEQTLKALAAADKETLDAVLVELGLVPRPAEKAEKAEKVIAPPKKERDIIIAAAHAPETTRPGLTTEIYHVAKAAGPQPREKLVELILDQVTPPRSKRYDRSYVLGYLAHGVREGYLKAEAE